METNQIFIIGIAVVLFLSILAIILLVHENEKKDLQSEIDSGVICRNLVRIAKHQEEIEKLEKKTESDQNVIDKLMTRVLGQGIEIEMLEMKQSNNKELRIAFDQASRHLNDANKKLEENRKLINELYGKNATEDERNGLLQEEIDELKKSRDYYKAKSNHKKRPVEVIHSDWWECITNIKSVDKSVIFTSGFKYKQVKDDNVFILIGNNRKEYWPSKKDFKPVQP